MRVLRATLKTEASGWSLALSVDTNTGYEGVTCCEWEKPWPFKAVCNGFSLGKFNTAVMAAVAVCEYRYVEEHPTLEY